MLALKICNEELLSMAVFCLPCLVLGGWWLLAGGWWLAVASF